MVKYGKSDKVVNSCGYTVVKCARDWNEVVMYMDPELAESLHLRLAPCTNQDFFTAYCKAHMEKYSEPFIWDTDNI